MSEEQQLINQCNERGAAHEETARTLRLLVANDMKVPAGKICEYGGDGTGGWSAGFPGYQYFDGRYRLVDAPRPVLMPYTWEDREELKGLWVRSTRPGTKHEFQITEIVTSGCSGGGAATTFEELFEWYVFCRTGDPVGKLR